jgi:hypothetical protein
MEEIWVSANMSEGPEKYKCVVRCSSRSQRIALYSCISLRWATISVAIIMRLRRDQHNRYKKTAWSCVALIILLSFRWTKNLMYGCSIIYKAAARRRARLDLSAVREVWKTIDRVTAPLGELLSAAIQTSSASLRTVARALLMAVSGNKCFPNICVVGLTQALYNSQACHNRATVHRIIQDRLPYGNRRPGWVGAKLTEVTDTSSPEDDDEEKYWSLLRAYEDESGYHIYRAARLAVELLRVRLGLSDPSLNVTYLWSTVNRILWGLLLLLRRSTRLDCCTSI